MFTVTPDQYPWAAVGFLTVVSLAMLWRLTHKAERKWYHTEIDSKLIIEKEA